MPLGYQTRRQLVTRPVQRMGQQQQGPYTSTLPQQYGQQQSGPYTTNVGQRPFMPYGGGAGYQAPHSPYGGVQGPLSRNQMPVPLTEQQQRQQQMALRPRDAEAMFDSGVLADQVPSNANPFSIAPVSPNDPRVLYGNLSRSKQSPGNFSGGGTSMYGGGRYTTHDSPGYLNDQENAAVAQYRQYDAAAGSGPYDSPMAAARFRSLGSTPQQQSPLMVQDPNASAFTGDAARVQAHNASGGNMAYRDTQGTPNAANLAYAARANQKQQMLQAGRNVRANRQYGTPLRPDLFPQAQAAYSPQGQVNPSIASAIAKNTVPNADGTTSIDWNKSTLSVFDDPKFKNDPSAAWNELRKQGFTSDDLRASIDSGRNEWGIKRHDRNEPYFAWLEGMLGASSGQGNSGGPLGAQPPVPQQQPTLPNGNGPLQAQPPTQPPEAPWNPNDPANSLLKRLPKFGFNPTNPFNPFPRR